MSNWGGFGPEALRVLKHLTVHMVGDKAGSLKAERTQLIRGQLSVSVMH